MSNTIAEMGTQSLLVSLHFNKPRQQRQSKKEARAIEQRNHAARGTSRASYFYFQQEVLTDGKYVTNDALFEVNQFCDEWSAVHRFYAKVPWDGGVRLLPAALAVQYEAAMKEFEAKAPAIWQNFFDVYPDWLATAPERMGDLYIASDFPSLEECQQRLGYERTMVPIPAAEQWKKISIISPDLAAQQEIRTNEKCAEVYEAARKETWNQLFEPVEHIVNTLSKDKPRIFDSMIENLKKILSVAPAYNFGGSDHVMAQFIKEAKETLATMNPDDLRGDPELQKAFCQQSKAFLAKFGQLGARKFNL